MSRVGGAWELSNEIVFRNSPNAARLSEGSVPSSESMSAFCLLFFADASVMAVLHIAQAWRMAILGRSL